MLTTTEVDQYIRLTLKQWNLSDVSVEWTAQGNTLGEADVTNNKIILNPEILCHFRAFEYNLKHEIAHFLQYKANGNKFLKTKSGKWNFHGRDFKVQCARVGIPASRTFNFHLYQPV